MLYIGISYSAINVDYFEGYFSKQHADSDCGFAEEYEVRYKSIHVFLFILIWCILSSSRLSDLYGKIKFLLVFIKMRVLAPLYLQL